MSEQKKERHYATTTEAEKAEWDAEIDAEQAEVMAAIKRAGKRKRGQRTLVADKDRRLIRIASIRALRDSVDKLPRVGWSALRELAKLGEETLRCLIERGAITPLAPARTTISFARRRKKPTWPSGIGAISNDEKGNLDRERRTDQRRHTHVAQGAP